MTEEEEGRLQGLVEEWQKKKVGTLEVEGGGRM
jgi:hypothetical protein